MGLEHIDSTPFFARAQPVAMNDPWIARGWLHDESNFEQLRLARLFMSGLAWLDTSVGTVLDTLRSELLERDTLVIATADHGASFLGKGHVYEAGVRVPLIVRWPARLAAGQRSRETTMLLDVAPSLLAAASAEPAASPEILAFRPAGVSAFLAASHGRSNLFTAAANSIEANGERLVVFELGYLRGALLWPWKLLLVNDLYDRCAPTDGGCRNLHGQLVEVTSGATGTTAQAHNASGGKRYGLGSMTYDAPARHAGTTPP